jgi:hypothetical protein
MVGLEGWLGAHALPVIRVHGEIPDGRATAAPTHWQHHQPLPQRDSRMKRRHVLFAGTSALLLPRAMAHHGWGSFDESQPIYLEGVVKQVTWVNPHATLVIEMPANAALPADLASRKLPAQERAVDAAAILSKTRAAAKRGEWTVELAPLNRMQAWQVPETKVGERVALIGYTYANEQGPQRLRAEYLFAGGQAYGLRSLPVRG